MNRGNTNSPKNEGTMVRMAGQSYRCFHFDDEACAGREEASNPCSEGGTQQPIRIQESNPKLEQINREGPWVVFLIPA